MDVAVGQLQQQTPGGFFNERKRYRKFAAYDMEVSIAYRICSQIQTASYIWTDQEGCGTNSAETMRIKRYGNYRSRSMPRPYSHANQHTAQVQCITNHRVSQRKK